MPFSMILYKNFKYRQQNSQLLNVTLQVRIQPYKRKKKFLWIFHGKKAFLSVSAAVHEMKYQRGSASLTLEAAIVLSLFIFAVVCMMLPMKIMNTERKIQAGLESVGEDFSRYAYLKDILDKGETFKVPGAGAFAMAFCGHLTAGAAEGYALGMVTRHVDTSAVKHVRMLRSSILEEGDVFDLILDYEIQMPFPILGMNSIERTARCRRRAWIGIAGKEGGSGGSESDSQNEIVYVGKNSTRYHRSRSCHYLANNLSAVSYDQISELRNDTGGKYYACRVCGSGAESGSTIYIMPGGASYHTTKNCRAIVAYARAVRLSEVEHLGACSYCGR